jgi:3-hydroxy-9,10-secoandrosta-1,3,5(10)-triene-9,17-dione monooxygenase reductase component
VTAIREIERAAVSGDELRHAIGHFTTGVSIVTSVDADGHPVGTTASAVASLSVAPPLLLVCLGRSSATLRAIRELGRFAVNVLSADQHELSTNFAMPGAIASWEGVSHRRWPSGIPRIDDGLTGLDCTVDEIFAGGDHEIVTGHVHAVQVSSQADHPLLHFRGAYARLDRT